MNYLSLFHDYLLFERNLSKQTLNTYETQVSLFLKYLNENNLEVDKIKSDTIRSYIEYRTKYNNSDSTISLIITVLRSFYRFLNKDGITENNPMLVIEFVKPKKRLPTTLTVEEIEKIISIIPDDKPEHIRDKALIEFLFSTGARISEVVNLTLNQINVVESTVLLHGKGSKDRITFIGDRGIKLLGDYVSEARNSLLNGKLSKYVFVGKRKEKLNRTHILTLVKRYAKIAGIEKNISPHTFRHSFGTSLIENGADLITVKTLLGHSNIATTQIYTHISKKHLKDIYNKSHPFGSKEDK